MFNQSTLGYVLHSRAYRETSLLVDLFSQNFGRFSLVAKGIKRKSSQSQRAILQPFSLLKIEYSGRSDLKVLCQVEPVGATTRLNGRAMACGYYINELMIRALQEWQEIPELFKQYQSAIEGLLEQQAMAKVLRNFEVALLSELGVAPDWYYDVEGNKILADRDYFFKLEHGFEQAEETNIIQQSHKLFTGAAILSLATGDYSNTVEKNCQQITQMLLRQIIGPKPLESRKLWL